MGGLITVLLSGFVIFNSFYVWPKLLPAAFLVLVVALVLSDEWVEARSRITGGLACGVGAAVAMLSHEGSVLVLIPLVIVTLGSRKRWPSLRCTAGAVAGVIALILPWTLYQRYYDPPGTSLSKLQLAGTTNFDPHVGLATAIIRAYQHLSFGQTMARKWSNLVTPFEHELTEVKYTVVLNPRLPFMVPPPTHVTFAELGLAGVGLAGAVLAGIWAPTRPKSAPSGSSSQGRAPVGCFGNHNGASS